MEDQERRRISPLYDTLCTICVSLQLSRKWDTYHRGQVCYSYIQLVVFIEAARSNNCKVTTRKIYAILKIM